MYKSLLATLFLGLMSASLPALSVDGVHACVVNIKLGDKNKIECYESTDLSMLKNQCAYRQKTFHNVTGYEVNENRGCPAGYYGVCRAKTASETSQYYYMTGNRKPSSFVLESNRDMCETKRNVVWEATN